MNDEARPDQGSIAKGIGLVLALHVAAALLAMLVSALASGDARNGLALFLGIGVVQVVYVLPAIVVCAAKHRWRTARGLAIGAGITFLVNATCAGIVLVSLR